MVGVLVERRGRSREGRLVVDGCLGKSGLLDGAMEQAGDDGAPDEDGSTHGSQDGANGNEEGALWDIVGLHERGILGVGDGGRRIVVLARERRQRRRVVPIVGRRPSGTCGTRGS